MSEPLAVPEPSCLADPNGEAQRELDRIEAAMLADLPAVDLPLVHRFTPGLYAREIFMPAGTLLTSKIHKTEHPYVVLEGDVSVFTEEGGVVRLGAGHIGVTKPGTRRLLYIHEDTRWVTFHPLVEGEAGPEDLGKIEERIIEQRVLEDGQTIFKKYFAKLHARELEGEPEGQMDYGGAP